MQGKTFNSLTITGLTSHQCATLRDNNDRNSHCICGRFGKSSSRTCGKNKNRLVCISGSDIHPNRGTRQLLGNSIQWQHLKQGAIFSKHNHHGREQLVISHICKGQGQPE